MEKTNQTFVMMQSIQNIRQNKQKNVDVSIDQRFNQSPVCEGQLNYTGKAWTNEASFENACETFQRWINEYEEINVNFTLIN